MRAMTKTRKRKSWPVGVSDTVLQDLCRCVVRREWGGRCALWGVSVGTPCAGGVEWHHVKRRRIPHLRYSPANGVMLCQLHHGLIKNRMWQARLYEIVEAHYETPGTVEWLDMMEMKLFPDFLAEKGMTRNEWRLSQKAYLRALLDGAEGEA
jgi:hypothetical protein